MLMVRYTKKEFVVRQKRTRSCQSESEREEIERELRNNNSKAKEIINNMKSKARALSNNKMFKYTYCTYSISRILLIDFFYII